MSLGIAKAGKITMSSEDCRQKGFTMQIQVWPKYGSQRDHVMDADAGTASLTRTTFLRSDLYNRNYSVYETYYVIQ